MKLPVTLIVSTESNHLLFGDATPSQIKSKGKYFNRGELTEIDNLIRELTYSHMVGASGRGSTSITVYLDAKIGNDSHYIEQQIVVDGKEFTRMLKQGSLNQGVFEQTYVAVFSGMTYQLEPYRETLFEQADASDQQKEAAKEQRKQERKERRERNRDVLEQVGIGGTVTFNGNHFVYLGEQFISYRRTNSEDVYDFVTQKVHAAVGYRTRGRNRGHYEFVTLDINSLELDTSDETHTINFTVSELYTKIDQSLMQVLQDLNQRKENHWTATYKVAEHMSSLIAMDSLAGTKEESVELAKNKLQMNTQRINIERVWNNMKKPEMLKRQNTNTFIDEALN